jgi:capsular polysaccharide biosynthesis protein
MRKSVEISQEKKSNNFEQEFDFYQLMTFIQQHYKTLLAFMFSGLLFGFLLTFVFQPQWEATALLRIGQLGLSGESDQTGKPIEDELQATDRINSLSFQNATITTLGLPMDEDNQKVKLLRKNLKAKAEKSGYVSVSLRGLSESEAYNNLNKVITLLQATHRNMAQPTIDKWNAELADLELDASNAKQVSMTLNKLLEGARSGGDKALNTSTLMSDLLISKEKEGKNLERIYKLRDRLNQDRTYPTAVVGQVAVLDKPAFPNKKVFSIIGMFIGLIASIVYIFLRTKPRT